MSTRNKLCFTLLISGLSITVNAATYKCEQNGQVTFSDIPCKGNAQLILQHPAKKPTPKATSNTKSLLAKQKKMADEMESSRLKQETELQIKSLENRITEENTAHDKELLSLNQELELIGDVGNYDDDDEIMVLGLIKDLNDKIEKAKAEHLSDIKEINEKITDLHQRLRKFTQ